MNELPSGWVLATLGDVARWGSGGTPRAGDPRFYGGQIPWAVIGDLTDGPVSTTATTITEVGLRQSSAKLVPPGAVLIAMYGSIGKLGLTTVTMATNQAIAFAIAHEGVVEPRYLMHFLRHQRPRLADAGKGATQRNIGQGTLKAWPMPVPPLEEQRRIVDILEDHLSRLDAAQAYLRASQRHLESLTSSWFRGSGLMSAPRSTLSQLLRSPLANGRSVPTRDGGFPVLRLTALAGERVRLSERKGGAWDEGSARPFLVERGDVLVSRGNGSLRLVARGALVAEDPDPVAFPDTMIRVRPRPEAISPDYLVLVWNSRLVRQQIEAIARTTAGIYKVNQRQLGQIELPVVPIDVQMRLLRDADELNVERGRMIDAVERAGAHTEALRRALLVAAFAGRLTGRSSDMDRVEELAGV